MWGCFCVLRFAFGVWRFALRHVILMAFRRFGIAVFGVRRVLRSRLCFAALPLGFGMRGEGLRFEGLIKLVILVGNRLFSIDGFGR
jgi:hypothetical protein